MLSWSYKGGFSGTSFVWENCFSRTGTASACAPSARRQRPCCRLLQRYIYSPLRKRFYKCRSGRAPLSLKQDCFFRVSSSKIKISLPGPPAADSVMIFHPEASSSRLRSDSFQKFATASQTLEFEKQSSLQRLSYTVAAVAATR